MKKLELILCLLFIATAIMSLANLPGGFFVLICAFILGIFYSVGTLSLLLPSKSERDLSKAPRFSLSSGKRAGAVLLGFAYAQSIVAILFKICNWPGGLIFLGLSVILLSSVLAISIFKQKKAPSPFYKTVIVRTSIIACIVVVLFIIAASTAKFEVISK